MVVLDGNSLTIEKIAAVARHFEPVSISRKAKERIEDSRKTLERLVKQGRTIYGVNTGFGAFADRMIPKAKIRELQVNLLRSTAAGVGDNLPTEVVRAMMTMRANTLAKGYSGVRVDVVELLVAMLEKRIHPIVPEKGSVGSSGDLAPLAHMALCLIGEGEAEVDRRIVAGWKALKSQNLRPLTLSFKEGLGLINGTELMTSIGALAVNDAEVAVRSAEIAAAISLEALKASIDPFDARIHSTRAHTGQQKTAENIRRITARSRLVRREKTQSASGDGRNVQDPYSLRCIPQILGPSRDVIAFTRHTIETEMNSATDNPLIFSGDGQVISGGNFHGQPISIALDILGIGAANIGNVAERRVARLLDAKLNNGLPAFLTNAGAGTEGLHSGYMVAQYTAANLVSENKILASPASVDSIPTSANQEDLNSMGSIAALKARRIIENVETIIAIELLVGAQALDFRGPDKAGQGTRVACRAVRKITPRLKGDRELRGEIERTRDELVHSGELVAQLNSKIGRLN